MKGVRPMAVLSEFTMDLCFIREAGTQGEPDFKAAVEQEIQKLFAPYAKWSVTLKKEDAVEIAVAEMKGIGPWQTEDDTLAYVETKAGEQFWEWLQGYRLQVEPKEDAGCCKCKH
jgi:hypothetical protein